MNFQETFQATATDLVFINNYYKNETYFEKNTYVSTCISIRGVRVRVRVHIKFANITIKCLQGANKLTLH